LPALSDGKMCFDMKFICLAFAGFIFQLSGISPLYAQSPADSLVYKESISELHRIYIDEIGDNAQIYHGSEYIRNGEKAIGFPYFEMDSMLTGTIYYQGNDYPDRHFFYNLVSGDIVIYNYAGNALITLSPLKADSFIIDSHIFLQLLAKNSNGLPSDGYYERLYGGEPGMYVRRTKNLVVGMGSVETKYIQYDNYFVKYKNVFYPVDSKNSILDLFKDEQDALKKYIRTNRLNFKKNLESSLVLTTIYYSRLKY
jgi:hypothetical protein